MSSLSTRWMVVVLLSMISACTAKKPMAESEQIAAIQKKPIREQVVDALKTEQLLSKEDLQVSETNGYVAIVGIVPNLRAKERIIQVAQEVPGVIDVTDRLSLIQVKNPKSDEHLQKDVNLILRLNPLTQVLPISTKVQDGVVTLTGKVDSVPDKLLADWEVKGIHGIRAVDNQIEVKMTAQPNDKELLNAVQGNVKMDKYLAAQDLLIQVGGGKVFLTGSLINAGLRARLLAIVSMVPGVRQVDSSALKVDPTKKTGELAQGDTALEMEVGNRFYRDPRIFSQNPFIEVNKGVVTLRGQVADMGAKIVAEGLARTISGVKDVVNAIEVAETKTEPRTDIAIQSDVRALLRLDPELDTRMMDALVASGKVTLIGQVSSWGELRRAQEVVSRTPGLKGLTNKLKVVPKSKSADQAPAAAEPAEPAQS